MKIEQKVSNLESLEKNKEEANKKLENIYDKEEVIAEALTKAEKSKRTL